ncbi:MAG: type IX secretion system protein PorQ, partial [Bacteroidetes bacterium]|nr:type IX secretion system protein PorQ [Bacteroidota bacterium]
MIKVGRIRLLGNALCALVLLLLTLPVSAQVGGDNTYDFLNIPNSARISSNGGGLVSINDADINLAVYNPGLIDSSLHGQLSLGYVDYFSDINAGIAAYAHHFQKAGTFLASMQYLHYGSFTETDEMGNIRGEFTAADYALGIGWAYHPDTNFTFGATWKTIYSSYFDYTSSGMALDIAATYTSRKRQFCATLLARNAGFQLTPYYEGHSEPLPFELQLGFSKKLKKAPLRIIGALTHLEKFDLTW